ncbi:hypothetical protein DM56_4575 [Burkholderia mallei]|nr:hypothetical protein DM56_4575 [Burkholderia mallei]
MAAISANTSSRRCRSIRFASKPRDRKSRSESSSASKPMYVSPRSRTGSAIAPYPQPMSKCTPSRAPNSVISPTTLLYTEYS